MSCKPTFYLTPTGECLTACPEGTYRNSLTWTCDPCPIGCKECINSTFCRQCNATYLYVKSTCVTTCPPSTYSETGFGMCMGCHYACATCTGPAQSNCLTCRPDYVWLAQGSTMCVGRCPTGMYPSNTSCLPCPNNCSNCSSTGFCLECSDAEKSNGVCCPENKFFNLTSKQCESCNPTCKVCNDSSVGSCTLCDRSRGKNGRPILGTCPCKERTVEVFELECPSDSKDRRGAYLHAVYGFVLVSFMMSSILATFAQQRIVFLKLLDFCQITSLYLYANVLYPYSMDWAFGMMRYANIEPLFQHIYTPMQDNFTVTDLRHVGISPILVINGQVPDSLKSTVYMLGLNIIGWSLVGTLSLINSMMSHHSAARAVVRTALRKIQYSMINNLLNLSIVTMLFAAVVNFKHVELTTNVGVASLATSSVSCLYIVGWLGICVKNILNQNKNFANMTVEQVKDVSKASQLYETIAMIRKVLLSVTMAVLFDNTTAQLGTAAGLSVAFLLYSIVCNPYGPFYKLFDILCELGNTAIAGCVMWLSFEPHSLVVGDALSAAVVVTSSLFTIASIIEHYRKPFLKLKNWIKSLRAPSVEVSIEIHPEELNNLENSQANIVNLIGDEPPKLKQPKKNLFKNRQKRKIKAEQQLEEEQPI